MQLYDWFTDISRPIREMSIVEWTRKLERFSSLLVFRTAYIHRVVLGTVGSTLQEILQLHSMIIGEILSCLVRLVCHGENNGHNNQGIMERNHAISKPWLQRLHGLA